MDTWIAILGGLLTTIISGFSGWFFTKKKYNAEVDNNLINNMQESLEFYKTLADDNKRRLVGRFLRKRFHNCGNRW